MILKIGLKYCDDCDPKYNRTASVKYIMDALGKRIEFVHYKNRDAVYILLVTSCDIVCPRLKYFKGKETHIITTIRDARKFVKEVSGILGFVAQTPENVYSRISWSGRVGLGAL